jgi:hypothetical protein
MNAYRIVPVLTEHGERFSIAVAGDGGRERRLAMVYGSRAEVEAALKSLELLAARRHPKVLGSEAG